MTNEEAIEYINKLYSMADLTDEYGDMIDTEPYEEAIAWVAQALEQQPCEDCVSRKEVIKCVEKFAVDEEDGSEYWRSRVNDYLAAIDAEITDLSPVKPITQWHMIKTRPLTEEEKDEMWLNDNYYTFMYDCEMPEDEQEVLIKTTWGIEKTNYYTDDGCYFENYEDEGDVIAWTELPEWEE